MSRWILPPVAGLIEPVLAPQFTVDGIGAIELLNDHEIRISMFERQMAIEAARADRELAAHHGQSVAVPLSRQNAALGAGRKWAAHREVISRRSLLHQIGEVRPKRQTRKASDCLQVPRQIDVHRIFASLGARKCCLRRFEFPLALQAKHQVFEGDVVLVAPFAKINQWLTHAELVTSNVTIGQA
jgi:hypothetical protein